MVATYDSLACNSFSVMSYLLGNVFGAYLYGAFTVQIYRYYISFPKDRKLFKAVIYIVYVTETICTVLLTCQLRAIVTTAGFQDAIICSIYTSQIVPNLAVCGGIVVFLTQSMYAHRIRIITKLRYMSWLIILMMVLQFLATAIRSLVVKTSYNSITFTWTTVSLLVDVTITSIMVWFLKKDEIYSKQLKRKIARLIYIILGTGLLTAATNLCILISPFRFPKHNIGLAIVISKLYANSMMVLVNSRIPSARSEINHRATLDMITVQLGTFHATSQAAASAEHGQREISVDLGVRSVGLSAHEAEETTNGIA